MQACDRAALLLEAIGHHYLQDAGSIGHLWQRWGSPDLVDFAASVASHRGGWRLDLVMAIDENMSRTLRPNVAGES